MPERSPEVVAAREFLEITRDFTDPKDVFREAISNGLDWGATHLIITVSEDRSRPDEELVIEVSDNGVGLNEERLRSFFDLGRSDRRPTGLPQIGYKGHGTKTYFNSRRIEVLSSNTTQTIRASMDNPLQHLMNNEVPPYTFTIDAATNRETATKIRIYGYNTNRRKQDFGHAVLRDYIRWKTAFGSVEKEFDITQNAQKTISLQGLGRTTAEDMQFGHIFPAQNCNIAEMRRIHGSDWPGRFCKKWLFSRKQIVDNPGKFVDMVFYIEGDEAKRSYNDMIRVRGRTPEYGMYKVEDRYGLWVCKDFIPIKRYNEWLGLGKRLETKYHAFVNCQEFRLTANRGDIGNTPPDLLNCIESTVRQMFEEDILGSNEYQEYDDAVELEEQYQTAHQEGKDFERRRRRSLRKKICQFQGVELIEPALEMGVAALFNLVYGIRHDIFPFHVIDYDTKRGYDAVVTQRDPRDLTRDTVYFVEFKHTLVDNFNHAFEHLSAVVCWDCNMGDGSIVRDITDATRDLRITPPQNATDYTHYMLVTTTGRHNIEVFVLKDYLREKLNIQFMPRPPRVPTT